VRFLDTPGEKRIAPQRTVEALIASASGAVISADSNIFTDCSVTVSAPVAGLSIRMRNNAFQDNGSAINAVAGANDKDNKIIGNVGTAPAPTSFNN